MSLKEEMLNYARQAGGSFRTREHRERTVLAFCRFLREQNIQTRHIREIRVRQVQAYTSLMKARDLEMRTMQNSLSALRVVLTAAGRGPFAQHWELSNEALGISGASRDGTHQPVSEELYLQVRARVLRDDPTGGIAAVLALQWTFGLRALEALCAEQDTLRRWTREIAKGKIEVIKGTKGGRPRSETVLDTGLAHAAVQEALGVLQRTGVAYLVIGRSKTLKSAYDRYHRCLRKNGLRAEFSSHGLRYAWVRAAMRQYHERGFSDREARTAVAQDLGHGDGRGRYVEQVYYGHGQPKK
ncbi:integrase domain-containing protein [Acidithiobacillus sp. MC6.1]|nr:integrase domain-containing protein [Acidithiobacillus sp. MC6.1]